MNAPNQPPELRSSELLDALQRHGVQFLVVGGFGAQLHGATRQTKDLEVRPAWGEENFDRLAAALEDLAARLRIPRRWETSKCGRTESYSERPP